tara:strand:- start:566 stop:922 length:357 start_codon:yes stop_codon:yes gene_type:complete
MSKSSDVADRTSFRKAVGIRSHDFWAGALSTIRDNDMRSWCASLIWWNHIKEDNKDSLLFQYMNEFESGTTLPIEGLEKAMDSIGLVAPPLVITSGDVEKQRMKNRTTHNSNKESLKK